MKIGNRIFLVAILALTVSVAGVASAQNILVNPDFETGDLTGWTVSGGNASATVTVPAGDNPLAGLTPIGTYCYHADMKGQYGDNFIWQDGYRGYLENNRWYCVEHYVKLNTPEKKDGILRGWIDGRPAFEKTDLRYRLVDKLRIEQVWMNIYHGGKKPSPYDQHAFIDNVVIASSYIGPMGR